MADAGDYGNFGSKNRARHYFLIERPQIFERTSTPSDDEHIGKFCAIEIIDRYRNFFRSSVALHLHWIEPHMCVWKPALQDAKNVADRGARGRRDDADATRQNGQRFLPRFVEEAFFLQALLQLFERQLQSAEADGLDIRDVNLIFAAHIVDADRTAHRDVQAVFGTEFQPARLITKTDASNLCARVPQGEIEVAGLRRAAIRDFALDPDVEESAFEQIADAVGELAHFPHAP